MKLYVVTYIIGDTLPLSPGDRISTNIYLKREHMLDKLNSLQHRYGFMYTENDTSNMLDYPWAAVSREISPLHGSSVPQILTVQVTEHDITKLMKEWRKK